MSVVSVPTADVRPLALAALATAYLTDPYSTFHKARYATRQHYRVTIDRLLTDHGHELVADITARIVIAWHAQWLGPDNRVAMAHTMVGMLRTLAGFGALMLEDADCRTLKLVLGGQRFGMAKPRRTILTTEQVLAIRDEAHALGLPSIALAQVLQCACIFRQKDVIGEWVPLSEPGIGIVEHDGMKWLRGVHWGEIDRDLILRHTTSKRGKDVEIDLKLAPLVIGEFQRMSDAQILRGGPLVINERTGLPYRAHQFSRTWRKIADAVGIPRDVRNMDTAGHVRTSARSRTSTRSPTSKRWRSESNRKRPDRRWAVTRRNPSNSGHPDIERRRKCQPTTTRSTLMQRSGSATSSQPGTSPQATLTSEASSMCGPTTSPDTASAISSPASADGPTRSGSSTAGPMTDLFGAGAAPARRSRLPASAYRARLARAACLSGALDELASQYALTAATLGLPTPGTFGRSFGGSSPSDALQSSLESKLQARKGLSGSPLFAVAWKSSAMTLGPPVSQLVASARRTSDNDHGGWVSPTAMDYSRGTAPPGPQTQAFRSRSKSAGWPTTRATDADKGVRTRGGDEGTATAQERRGPSERSDGSVADADGGNADTEGLQRGGEHGQQPQDGCVGWPTPSASGFEGTKQVTKERRKKYAEKYGNNGFGLTTAQAAQLTSWPTPTANDSKGGRQSEPQE